LLAKLVGGADSEHFAPSRHREDQEHESEHSLLVNAQRILFEPYQYKPLLKLLDSADRRLLIADEVGLGKTIEAGLVLAELEARQPLDKVLVVWPSRLRQKWQVEMEGKFGRDFKIYSSLNSASI